MVLQPLLDLQSAEVHKAADLDVRVVLLMRPLINGGHDNTSTLLRLYYVSYVSAHRFPVSFSIGTYGANTPTDVGSDEGGALRQFSRISLS